MVLGIIVIIVGVILFFAYQNQNQGLRGLQSAKKTSVAELTNIANSISQEIGGGDWRDYVKIWGKITVDEPILSELQQEPCVYYEMKIQREYEERKISTDSDGNRRERMVRRTENISQNTRFIPFFVEDRTGKILVNPDEAKIETIKVVDEFRQVSDSLGMLQYGGFSLMLNNSFSRHGRTLGYRYQESILPVNKNVLIVGQVSDETGDLMIQKPLRNQENFIISFKTNEALINNYRQNKQYLFYGYITSLIIGIIIVIISVL